jgi:hypothetical protein
VQHTVPSNEIITWNPKWINQEPVDIWRWCHTPFQSYRPQLYKDSDNIRFKFHFLVRETHKAICAIRDCKKKTQILRGEKEMKKHFLATVSHTIREPAPSSTRMKQPDYIWSLCCWDIVEWVRACSMTSSAHHSTTCGVFAMMSSARHSMLNG